MKKTLCLMLFAVALFGATTKTRIQDTIYRADGTTPASGYIIVSWQDFVASSGETVRADAIRVEVVAGAVDVSLYPTTTATPNGVSYTVRYFVGAGKLAYWVVPPSGTPLRISNIQTLTVSGPEIEVQLSQLARGGATHGQVVTWDSTLKSYAPKDVSGISVSSVYGRTGAVVAVSGDYTTDLVTEGLNKYYTDARARAALSAAAPIEYNSTTGEISCSTCGAGSSVWGSITGTLSNQTDLNSALSGKAATGHGHAISDTTNLQATLDGKAASSHGHGIGDTTNLQATLDGKAATSHAHSGADVTSGTVGDSYIPTGITRDSEVNVQGTTGEITSSGSGVSPTLSLAATFDISGKTSTKPVKAGTSLPATCGVGELFYKTDATAGQNLYGCTAVNTWTVLGGAGGGGTPGGSDTQMQYNDAGAFGGAPSWLFTKATDLFTGRKNGISTTTTPLLALENQTAATSGTQQYAPAILFSSNIWDSGAAASKNIKWYIEGLGNQQGSAAAGIQPNFRIGYRINDGTYVPWFHQYNHPDGYDSDFNLANLFLGTEAGSPSTMTAAAMANIGIGWSALTNLTSGSENLAFGNSAGNQCTSCYWNTMIGNEAGIGLTSGYQNVFVGQDSGRGVSNATAITTGQQNTHFGVGAGPCAPTQVGVSNTTALGYGTCVQASNTAVLTSSSQNATVGGLPEALKTLDVADPSSLGAETFTNGSFDTSANWQFNTDFSWSGGAAVWTHSAGGGSLIQTPGNFAIAMQPNRWYAFTYTVSGYTGSAACYAEMAITKDAPLVSGTWTLFLRSWASAGNFTFWCSSSSGGFTIDNVSLKEVTAGDVRASGSLQGGTNIVASASTTTLPAGNAFRVTGTTSITALNTCDTGNAGRAVTLVFDSTLTVTDGNNLKLAGNFSTTADDTLSLVCDGSNWYETARQGGAGGGTPPVYLLAGYGHTSALGSGGTVRSYTVVGEVQMITTDDSLAQIAMPRAGTLTNFYLRFQSPPNSQWGNSGCVIRKNGVDTALSLMWAGDGAIKSDTDTDTVSVAQYDLLSMWCVNNANAGEARPLQTVLELQ